MTRTLLSAALLGLLLALAPVALAQEEKPADNTTRPDDAAWTEDCPPDMMCAYAGGEGEPHPYGNESCIECSGPSDGAVGPDGCRECMTPPSGTCMDGASDNETCQDDVQYLDGRGPVGCENCRGEEVEASTDASAGKDAPFAGLLLVAGAIVLALILVGRR